MAIFGRRHYQVIAEEFSTCHKLESAGFEYTKAIADRFANMFSRDNPNFKRERFLKACGMEEKT